MENYVLNLKCEFIGWPNESGWCFYLLQAYGYKKVHIEGGEIENIQTCGAFFIKVFFKFFSRNFKNFKLKILYPFTGESVELDPPVFTWTPPSFVSLAKNLDPPYAFYY